MENYLQETKLLDFKHSAIQKLIIQRGWEKLDEFNKIAQIYSYVRNEILFGYNESDNRKASEVLQDGIGQCNTKATLLMALLRAVGVPCRHHAFWLDNQVQKGVAPQIFFYLAPKQILHTWVEVQYQEEWYVLEGVILDQDYITGFQKMYQEKYFKNNKCMTPCKFQGFGFGVDDLFSIDVEWVGKSTYVQSTGIEKDLGIFASPDECFQQFEQDLGPVKTFIYSHFARKTMTARVKKIRGSSIM